MEKFYYYPGIREIRDRSKKGASSKSPKRRKKFPKASLICCIAACLVLSGCNILGGDDEIEEFESGMLEVFIGVWEKDNSGGSVLLDFTETTWTARYEGATYNSGTYDIDKTTGNIITAKLKVTNKGTGSANVGNTGNASLTLGDNKITVSGFSDANMNGQYSNPDLSLVSSVFDGVLTGTVENRPANDSIYSIAKATIVPPDYEGSRWIVAEGNYANGNFSITLMATPPALFLNKITDFFPMQQVFGSASRVSDENALICAVDHLSAATQANEAGAFTSSDFYLRKVDEITQINVLFVYSDRDVTMVESNQFQTTSIVLKKGWNKLYKTQPHNSQRSTVSTKAVDGVNWYF